MFEIVPRLKFLLMTKQEILSEYQERFPHMRLTHVIYDPDWPLDEPCWILGGVTNIEICWAGSAKHIHKKKPRGKLNEFDGRKRNGGDRKSKAVQ